VIGKLESCLKYGIPILGLSIICPTFWLILGVTLAGLIIGAQLVRTASKKQSKEVKKAGMKRVSQWKYKPPVHKPEDHVYLSIKERNPPIENAPERPVEYEEEWGWLGRLFLCLFWLAIFGLVSNKLMEGGSRYKGSEHCSFSYRGGCNG